MGKRINKDYMDFSGHSTVCAQCGYSFVRGDDALRIKETGDVIHRGCLMDYTEDNVGELTDSVNF